MTPFVVTLAVHYESVEDCRKMVESLQLIDYPHHRVVIVDNCSAASTYLSLEAALAPFDCELIRNERNIGFGGGVNFAFQYALKYNPAYLHVINTDSVVVEGDYLGKLVQVMEEDPKIGIIGPAVLKTDGQSLQNTILPFISLRAALFFNSSYSALSVLETPPQIREVACINGVCFMMPVSAFQAVHGFDERYFMYGEEQDLCYYLAKSGYKRIFWSGKSILHFGADREAGYIDWRYLYSRKNQIRFLKKVGRWPEGLLLSLLFFSASSLKLLSRRIRFRGESVASMWSACFSPWLSPARDAD
jgi:GT2 family glycosyltransferase